MLQNEYKKSIAFLYPIKGTLLPHFTEDQLNELSAFQMNCADDQEFIHSPLGSSALSLSSLVHQKEKEFLVKSLKFTTLESLGSSFLGANQMMSKLKNQHYVAWHISPVSSMVGVFKVGEILFYNQFELTQTEDLLYYTLHILDELKIATQDASVYFSGRIQSISLEEKLLADYLYNWKYTDQIDGLALNYINQAARIRNYTLLNSFRCV